MSVATVTNEPVDVKTARTQAEASDPTRSAWVSANAGSGKTFVLSRRVIRLLLAGVDPARILCLTFTKAAAAEMAKRVFLELGNWTALSDEMLFAELEKIEGKPPDLALVAEARRLFARALDTPGGLKIQTIHAFCERLLHQFPFEANVAGHFEVLDERDAAALHDAARRAILSRAAGEPDGELGRSLATVLSLVSDTTHEESVTRFIDSRDKIGAWIVAAGSLEGAIAELRKKLAIGEHDTVAAIRRKVVAESPLDAAEAARLIDRLRKSGTSDQAAADRLAPYATWSDEDQRIAAWLDFFLTDGKLRKSLVTNAIKAGWPGLGELLDTELKRLEAVVDRIRAAQLFESSAAMLRLANAAIAEYSRMKQQRGVLDFEDLVIKTVTLLSRADASRWVHYKLDRGLDHILVDEAQDTSPRQWQVVRALAEEFFAGEGASEAVRTLFAVGDEKQSIFSFQGAVPAWFTRTQHELGDRARLATFDWSDLELHISFRSVPVVLQAVDTVFSSEEAFYGLAAEPKPTIHEARRQNEPGRVVVWPVIEPLPKPEPEDWASPVDHLGRDSPEVRLAERIAGTIRGWLDAGTTLDAADRSDAPRPIQPGGILILMRSRGALTDAINRALKTKGIPIAGADRLRLTEHIAVMDLMALGRVVLLPEDDLSLAALLRSPLVGLDEDALFALAHGRQGSLWASLKRMASEREDFAAAKALIDGWRAAADYRDPHALFARILGPGGGRRALLRRLGPEAEDVIDEFLAQSLAYERTSAPSLEGFLAWLIASETEIKRDTDTLRNEVRVMTVHGAKGLEADIVFLVDNGARPVIAMHDERVLSLSDDTDPRNPGALVWMRSIKQMPASVVERVRAWRERSEEEYRRLLYVGMTRAKDWLYVVGIANQNTDRAKGWHGLVTGALESECSPIDAATQGYEALEWRAERRGEAKTAAIEPATSSSPELPVWATTTAAAAAATPRRLTPSTILRPHAGEDSVGARFFATKSDPLVAQALERGRLIHRLLQSLPDIPPAMRQSVGSAYLEAFAGEWPEEDRSALLTETLRLLDHPDLTPVFSEGSRAEVEIAGRILVAGRESIIAGRIDRLAVTTERVLIVDYKTNRPAPSSVKDAPAAYVAQLAVYRQVLKRLYPRQAIVAAIIWTDGPSIMEIPSSTLDAALATMAWE